MVFSICSHPQFYQLLAISNYSHFHVNCSNLYQYKLLQFTRYINIFKCLTSVNCEKVKNEITPPFRGPADIWSVINEMWIPLVAELETSESQLYFVSKQIAEHQPQLLLNTGHILSENIIFHSFLSWNIWQLIEPE